MSQVKEMYKDGQFRRLKECTGTDNFTGEENVQGQTITWNFISNLFQNIYLSSSQELSQCLLELRQDARLAFNNIKPKDWYYVFD